MVRAEPVSGDLSSTVLTALLELYRDSPAQFEKFAKMALRNNRPAWGSITLTFQDGKMVTIEKRETIR